MDHHWGHYDNRGHVVIDNMFLLIAIARTFVDTHEPVFGKELVTEPDQYRVLPEIAKVLT